MILGLLCVIQREVDFDNSVSHDLNYSADRQTLQTMFCLCEIKIIDCPEKKEPCLKRGGRNSRDGHEA